MIQTWNYAKCMAMKVYIIIERKRRESLLVKNCIKFSLRSELNILNDNIESIFIEIDKSLLKFSNNIIIGTIYRPPSCDIHLFMNEISLILNKLNKENKSIFIMGDYNVNLLNSDKNVQISEFIELMYSCSFLPLINRPTRIHKNSVTLIDNIFCNCFNKNIEMFSGIFSNDITDHYPVFCITKLHHISKEPQYIETRSFNDENIEAFIQILNSIDWNFVTFDNKAQTSFTLFYNKFVDCFNGCFPLKRVKIKYRNRKSWLSTGLKKSIKIKNKLYIKSLKYPTVHNISTYKAYRNKLQSLVRKSEREHYDDLLMQNKCNLSKSWKIIKEVINKNKINVKPDKIIINNEPVTDNLQIANHFNEFYVNIGHDLSRDIPNIRNDPTGYIPANLKYSMFVSRYSD